MCGQPTNVLWKETNEDAFRPICSQVYTVGNIIQGRRDGELKSVLLFLDAKKVSDPVWRNGSWKKSWEVGIRGKMWTTMKSMKECATSTVMLGGGIS